MRDYARTIGGLDERSFYQAWMAVAYADRCGCCGREGHVMKRCQEGLSA